VPQSSTDVRSPYIRGETRDGEEQYCVPDPSRNYPPVPAGREQRNAAERAKCDTHDKRERTGQSMVAHRVGIEPADIRQKPGGHQSASNDGQDGDPHREEDAKAGTQRLVRRPHQASYEEHQTNHQADEWNVIESQVRFNRNHVRLSF
jgi:hypothetical protein